MEDAHRPIELMDLGDAVEETKQCTPYGVFPDSWFQWGSQEWTPGPPQC